MTLKGVWLDLHASDFEGNVMTEYEKKDSQVKDQVIYRVEALVLAYSLQSLGNRVIIP